jgi:predicted phage terminase large subunit-like protein
LGGGLVKAEWFKRYGASERPESFDRILQSWDTANKATELSDFSVCTTWGIKGKDFYLLNVLRKRLEYPALKRAVREQQSLFNANVVLIEDKASGTQLIQELIADGCHRVTRYKPECDKIMRLHAQTAIIENGFVHLPDAAPWLAEYLHEMTVFPKGKHDDQVIGPLSSSTGSKNLSRARRFSSSTDDRPSNSNSGQAFEFSSGRPTWDPCKPSRAGTSTSARMAPSRCLPRMPST